MPHPLRRSVAALFLIAGLAPAVPASASPWLEAGDRQARSDLELLESYRLVDGVVSGWPIPWAQVVPAFSARDASLPPHVRQSIARLRARYERETAQRAWHPELRARLTSDPPVVRGFGSEPRQEIDARASAEYMWSSTAVRLAVGLQSDIDFGDAHPALDGSYAAQELGNWLFYAGYLDHWWGDGWISSMILSNSARPFPRIGLMRNEPKGFETPVLSWIGPWQVNAFVGLLEDAGRVIETPAVFGLRAAISPLPGLELAGSRIIQFCGEGRPCNLKTFGKAFFGNDNTGNQSDPSNQLGGFDARYSNRIGPVSFSVYGQYIGEDEAGGLPSRAAALAGVSLAGPAGAGGAHWRLVGELSDSAASVLNKSPKYNVSYNHFIYRTGYRYRGRPIADSVDNDAKLFSLAGWLTDTRDWTYRAAYHRAELNRDDVPGGNTVSRSAENIDVLEVGLEIPWRGSTFELGLRYQSDDVDTPGRRDEVFAVGAGWRIQLQPR